MKTTMVPAQVTTVEDKIAGSLGLTQLILLCVPIFFGGLIYAGLPPILNLNILKTVLIIVIVITFSLLAIRFKGRLMINWIFIIGRYILRPRFYIYNKNELYLRGLSDSRKIEAKKKTDDKPPALKPATSNLAINQLVKLQSVVEDPRANLRFTIGKNGGLDVHITKIK